MRQEIELRKAPPRSLITARAIGHKAVQFATKAARANLPAKTDDSHSNLGWDSSLKAFFSQPLPAGEEVYFAGVSFSPLKLLIMKADRVYAELNLENISEDEAAAWLDENLHNVGLKPTSMIDLPYELPLAVEAVATFSIKDESTALAALSEWFDLAHNVLSEFANAHMNIAPGPSDVRCWPHHFDIAAYVGLEEGDFETAKGIGVGMSPGDEGYEQPYFYINPWPHLNADELPQVPNPGHWHTDGFVGAIATAEEILSLSHISEKLPYFVEAAFSIGRKNLGV